MTNLGITRTTRPMKILLFGVLLAHLGTYMIIPLMPIFLKLDKGMSVAQIGLILAVSPFTFQAGSLLGGWLADRFGRRAIIAIGAWLNAIAISGFAYFDTLWLFLCMGLLSGVGVGLNAPSTKAAIATLAATEGTTTTAFSLRGIAANVGIATAGLLTYYVLGGPSPLIFYVSAIMYVLLGVISWLLLPKGCGDAPCKSEQLRSYTSIFRNRAFMVFSLVAILMWALYTQLVISLPLRAEDVLTNPGMVSLIWTVNSILVISLQSFITRWIIDKFHPMTVLSAGSLFLGAGLGSLYWAGSFVGLLVSGLIFVIGEMLIVPTSDATVSRLGNAAMLGAFFGITNFVYGVGEGAGKYAGGQLLAMGTSSATPWLTYAVLAVILCGALIVLRVWKPMQAALARSSEAYEGDEPVHEREQAGPLEEGHATSLLDRVFRRKNRAK